MRATRAKDSGSPSTHHGDAVTRREILLVVVPLAALMVTAAIGIRPGAHVATTTDNRARPFPAVQSPLVSIERYSDEERSQLRLLDPVNLGPVSGVPPIELGYVHAQAVSPDGGRLAVVTSAHPRHVTAVTWQLRVIDLRDGSTIFSSEAPAETSEGVFSRDGRTIYWVNYAVYSEVGTTPRLYRAQLEETPGETRMEQIATLPTNLLVRGMEPTAGGGVAIFGSIDDWAGTPHRQRADAQLIVVDTSGRLTALPLPDVALLRPDSSGGNPSPAREEYTPGLAWDTDAGLLRIVHADRDKVTTVRLSDLKVLSSRLITPERTIASTLLTWLVPSAHAKELLPSTDRSVELGSDGETMFVSGSRRELVWRDGRVTGQRWIPLGLSVVRTSDFREVATIGKEISELMVAPGGGHIVVHQGVLTFDMENAGPPPSGRMSILRASDLHPVRTFGAGVQAVSGFSRDGRYAYLSGCPNGNLEGPGQLMKVELQSGKVIARVAIPSCHANLAGPAAPAPA